MAMDIELPPPQRRDGAPRVPLVGALARSDGRAEWIIFGLFAAALAWCPFWLGSNRVLAWGVNAVLFPALLIAYELHLFVERKRHPVTVAAIGLSAGLFAVVVLWIVLQGATWTPAALHHPIWVVGLENCLSFLNA